MQHDTIYCIGSNHPSPQVYDLEGSQKSSQTQLAQVQIADQALLISWFHSIDQHNSEALRRLRCPRWGFQTSIHLWWPPLERKAAPLEERPCPASCPFRRGDRNLALHMWIIVNIYIYITNRQSSEPDRLVRICLTKNSEVSLCHVKPHPTEPRRRTAGQRHCSQTCT